MAKGRAHRLALVASRGRVHRAALDYDTTWDAIRSGQV